MKNKELQRSDELSAVLVPYTEHAPLMALGEVEQLISHHSLGQSKPTHPINRIIMTLTGLTIAIVMYLAISHSTSQVHHSPKAVSPQPNVVASSIQDTAVTKEHAETNTTAHVQRNATEGKSKDIAEKLSGAKEAEGSLINYFEISKDDLARIGILPEGILVTYFYTRSDSRVGSLGLLRTWGAVVKDRPLPEGVSAPESKPTFVTDGIGRKRIFSYANNVDSAERERMHREINSLVPILVREEGDTGPIDSLDLIFWYLPTQEFLSTLPDSVRTLALDQSIKNGGTNSSKVLAVDHRIQKAMVFPNPSPGRMSLQLQMDEPQRIVVVLRDLLGKAITSSSAHDVGERSTVGLDFNVPDGIYLLEITPQHGERRMQRVVIQR
jgi:hypothetical protein